MLADVPEDAVNENNGQYTPVAKNETENFGFKN